jgi:hypothetical protein
MRGIYNITSWFNHVILPEYICQSGFEQERFVWWPVGTLEGTYIDRWVYYPGQDSWQPLQNLHQQSDPIQTESRNVRG